MNWKHVVNRYRIVPILQLIFGIGLAFLNGLCLLVLLFTDGGDSMRAQPPVFVVALFLFGVPFGLGIWLILLAVKNYRIIAAYERYAPILDELPDGSVAVVARVSGDPVELVRANLLDMIKRGFFPQGYLDPHKEYLILPGQSQRQSVLKESVKEPVMLNCPHCGGRNLVTPGTRIICEFCDSEIY